MAAFRMVPPRRGFTLIELLVAMAIIIVLSALAVLVIPSTSANNAVIRTSDQVTSWLVSARNRALRDRAPRGIHLIRDASNQVREIELVEQPDPFRPVVTSATNPNLNGQVAALRIDPLVNPIPSPGPGATDTATLVGLDIPDGIQPGDLLRVNFTGTDARVYRITAVAANAGNVNLTVSPRMAEPIEFNNAQTVVTRNYTIIRSWRPLAGEPALQLPKGSLIDLTGAYSLNIPNRDAPAQEVVIMFSKAGPILDSAGGKIILGVRRPDEANAAIDEGEPILISIYARTGAVSSHPRSEGADPFVYARDGKGSGL